MRKTLFQVVSLLRCGVVSLNRREVVNLSVFCSKLQINSEKLIKNEELLILRGGYDQINCGIICSTDKTCTSYPGECVHCRPHPWRPEYWCTQYL